MGVAGYLVGTARSTSSGSLVPRLTNPAQLTATVGVEYAPTWSPDGSRIAYVSSPTHQLSGSDVWVVQADGGPPVNLTEDHDGRDTYPAWSPDGTQIAFESSRDGGGCYLMPALGGPVSKVIGRAEGALP